MHYRFSVQISYHEFQALYKGEANKVLVVDDFGRRIQLPAVKFLPYLDQSGISGTFKLVTDKQNRFQSLQRAK